MTLELALDFVVAALLAAMIGYSIVLNRRLGALRTGREDLARMIQDFGAATERAEASIARLKQHSGRKQSDLEERIDGARAIREELAFLIDRAESQGDRLEGLIRSGRREEGAADKPAAAAPPRGVPQRSAAEQELMQTLQTLR